MSDKIKKLYLDWEFWKVQAIFYANAGPDNEPSRSINYNDALNRMDTIALEIKVALDAQNPIPDFLKELK